MNRIHRWYCRSDAWRRTVRERLLPWVVGRAELGDRVLEVGPGPGVTTDVLRSRTEHLTAVEIDPALAAALAVRLADTNVTVVRGDGTRLPFPDCTFSSAISCTMLHHVPSSALQDCLLAEVRRVLRPGGLLVGSDSISSLLFRAVHLFDTLVAVPPETFGSRLRAHGFRDVAVDVHARSFRFRARA